MLRLITWAHGTPVPKEWKWHGYDELRRAILIRGRDDVTTRNNKSFHENNFQKVKPF